jgi:hypothetical protein
VGLDGTGGGTTGAGPPLTVACPACLPPMRAQEKIKELTERFTAELEADRQKFDLLLQEKNEQVRAYVHACWRVGKRREGGAYRAPKTGNCRELVGNRACVWCVGVWLRGAREGGAHRAPTYRRNP